MIGPLRFVIFINDLPDEVNTICVNGLQTAVSYTGYSY